MGQEKSMKLNKVRTDEFLKSLDDRASKKNALVYQAIIVSLLIHIFILFVTQMLTQDNRMAKDEVNFMPLEMDMVEEQAIEEREVPLQQESQAASAELRNLVANELSERSSSARSYRGMTKEQIDEQVYNDLKNMEAEEFARLQSGRLDDPSVSSNKPAKTESPQKPSDYDWYKEKQKSGSNNTSYQGNVTASYSMGSRSNLRNPTPTYRCKVPGKVVMKVTINSMGSVSDVVIDQSKSTLDECLRTESEKYARLWKFDAPSNAPKKFEGSITFTFSAQ
jgi:outer membrane biosynthesis protein TonB